VRPRPSSAYSVFQNGAAPPGCDSHPRIISAQTPRGKVTPVSSMRPVKRIGAWPQRHLDNRAQGVERHELHARAQEDVAIAATDGPRGAPTSSTSRWTTGLCATPLRQACLRATPPRQAAGRVTTNPRTNTIETRSRSNGARRRSVSDSGSGPHFLA
jgi:hypothetical protein